MVSKLRLRHSQSPARNVIKLLIFSFKSNIFLFYIKQNTKHYFNSIFLPDENIKLSPTWIG